MSGEIVDPIRRVQAAIKEAVKAHNITKPIMSSRLVGNRLELHLYGGETVVHLLVDELPAVPVSGEAKPKARRVKA